MYYPNHISPPILPLSDTCNGVVAAFARALSGTGSVYDLTRASEWGKLLEPRVSFNLSIGNAQEKQDQSVDLRTASDHLDNIRKVLKTPVSDLAVTFGVTRQAVYKWIGQEAEPESDRMRRIARLSSAADSFDKAEISRASSLVKMKAFEGRSLLELVASDQLEQQNIDFLVEEAKKMDGAYNRAETTTSKAKPMEDWRAEHSIPGAPE